MLRENPLRLGRFRRDVLLVQQNRAVPASLDRANAIAVPFVHDLAMRRRQPLAFDDARVANEIAGDVEDDQELAVAVVDLARQRCARS
jgi:hypothetical protein